MNLRLSNQYERCLALAHQSMLPYFEAYGLIWIADERLASYRSCQLYEVVDDVTVGYVALRENNGKLFIADFQIQQVFRNRGYGTQSLASVAAIARSMGYDTVYLKVFKNNPALNLYLRNGYTPVAKEQTVYLLSAKTA